MIVSFSCSLSYILNGMSQGIAFNDSENSKLFVIKLDLFENRLRFMPTLSADENDKDSFIYTIHCLINDICSISHQINRIAQPTSKCTAMKRTYQSRLIVDKQTLSNFITTNDFPLFNNNLMSIKYTTYWHFIMNDMSLRDINYYIKHQSLQLI